MIRSTLPLTLALLAACHDPRLDVTIKVPPAYSSLVAQVLVEVLQPPVGEALSCDSLAFGKTSPEVVRLSRLREVGLSPTADLRTIGEVDRTTRHVFLAHGGTSDGTRLLTGCAELSAFSADTAIDIELWPVVSISLPPSPYFAVPAGASLPEPISAEILDARGKPAAGVPLRWSALGGGNNASNKTRDGEISSDADGKVKLQPTLPDTSGPVAVDLRARWAASSPVRVPGFVQPPTIRHVVSESGLVTAYQVGRLGPSGQTAIAAITVEKNGPLLRLCYPPAAGEPLACQRDVLLPAPGKLVRLPLADHDRLLVVTNKDALVIDRGAVVSSRPHSQPGEPDSLVSAGSCPQPDQAIATFSTGNVLFDVNATASPTKELPGLMVASGCVSSHHGDLHRLFVAINEKGESAAYVLPSFAFPWTALPFGISFPPPQDGRYFLLSVRPNIDQLVIARGLLRLDGQGAPAIDTVEYDPVPGRPLETDGGDLDGDGRFDVATLLAALPPAQSPQPAQGYLLWMAVGNQIEGLRVTGMLPLAPYELCEPRLFVADMNGDGVADIVLTDPATCPTGLSSRKPPARAFVMLMGAQRKQ